MKFLQELPTGFLQRLKELIVLLSFQILWGALSGFSPDSSKSFFMERQIWRNPRKKSWGNIGTKTWRNRGKKSRKNLERNFWCNLGRNSWRNHERNYQFHDKEGVENLSINGNMNPSHTVSDIKAKAVFSYTLVNFRLAYLILLF